MAKTTAGWVTHWPERISYGLSDAADNLVFQMMTTYLLFFYTDVYGLSASAVAILFVVARVADVAESFIIGVMIDRTHSKFGKSRPFFLWYAFPYVIFAVLTFITPGFSYGGKLAWAYFTYLGLGFLYTAVNLPITSILPTMSQNSRELTLLGVIRQFFWQLGSNYSGGIYIATCGAFRKGKSTGRFSWHDYLVWHYFVDPDSEYVYPRS